jgi:hypothetical protein
MLTLIDGFEVAKVPYALCGALALAVHGHPRATKDIDLIVPAASVNAAKAIARACGFAIESLPMRFRQADLSVQCVSKFVDNVLVMLDILVGSENLDDVWNARVQIQWKSRTLWCVSRAGLVSMKLAAGRPQDLADVARLEEST